MSKTCPNCGVNSPDNAKFCIECAYSLEDVPVNKEEKPVKTDTASDSGSALGGIILIAIIAIAVDNLKNVSSEKEAVAGGEAWTTYPPDFATPHEGDVNHFRSVYFVKDDKVYVLSFTTTNPSTSLYTHEIDGIINSLAPAAKK